MAVSGLALGTSQCIWGTDEPFLAGGALPALQPVATTPLYDASDVPVVVAPGVRWNDRVHPDSLLEGEAALLEGTAEVEAAPHVDLIACTVEVRPATALATGTTYTARFDGLWGFSTRTQRAPVELTFTTGGPRTPPSPELPPSFAEVYGLVIGPRCASCHDAYRPPLGLDLSSPEAAEEALRFRSSVDRPERPLVAPGHHAASYVMWKVLGLPDTVGDPMPPDGPWPIDRACRTPDPGLRALADWIDGLSE